VLQISRSTIGRMTRSKSIPSIKIGQQYRYEHRAVLSALKKKNS
jgi:excisionase family DNA binding protein